MTKGLITKVSHADYEVEMNLTGDRAEWVQRVRDSGLYGSSRSHTVECMWPDSLSMQFSNDDLRKFFSECQSLNYLCRWSSRRGSSLRYRQKRLDNEGTCDNYPILISMSGYMAFILERIGRVYPEINTKFDGIELLIDDWFMFQAIKEGSDRIVPGITAFGRELMKKGVFSPGQGHTLLTANS